MYWPLTIAITSHSAIIGHQAKYLTEKIGMYVDNTLLYLADSDTSLSTALALRTILIFSGLKINWISPK